MKTVFFLLAVILALPAWAQTPEPTSCTTCHEDADLFDEELVVIPEHFLKDVHASVGLSCHDCHGGNPDPALAEETEAAMDPDFAGNPYRGTPSKSEVPAFCGSCHSDAAFMRHFRPDIRVDQEQEYRTSHHGKALLAGDTRVATCTDCHGVHGMLRVGDPESPVYPTRVAETCGSCHSDPARMAGSTLSDGRPVPVDQHARWNRSVHAKAMFERGDLSAPTCNDCHGNHGASPPDVESVAFVCGHCHGRETDLFRASGKYDGFREHNENLEESEGESCAGCHEQAPQSELNSVHTFSECTTCHGNHAVVRPTVAMLGLLPETPCVFCHEAPDTGEGPVMEQEKTRKHYEEKKRELLELAAEDGLEGDDRFDWLVRQALTLPTHTTVNLGEEGEVIQLRPEFARLFQRFRIGETHFTFTDPVTGEERRESVVTCQRCHAEEPELADEAVGLRTAREQLRRMQELTSHLAVAERTLLAAERGGVQLHGGLIELDQGVDSQIELEVLVHAFSAEEGGVFAEKHLEGMTHAAAALEMGQAGLAELSNRRKGLAVALVFIALTLGALVLRIRALGDDES